MKVANLPGVAGRARCLAAASGRCHANCPREPRPALAHSGAVCRPSRSVAGSRAPAATTSTGGCTSAFRARHSSVVSSTANLTAAEYGDALRTFTALVYHTMGMPWSFFVEQSVRLHKQKIPVELLEEMEGIAAGFTKGRSCQAPWTTSLAGTPGWRSPATGGPRSRASTLPRRAVAWRPPTPAPSSPPVRRRLTAGS